MGLSTGSSTRPLAALVLSNCQWPYHTQQSAVGPPVAMHVKQQAEYLNLVAPKGARFSGHASRTVQDESRHSHLLSTMSQHSHLLSTMSQHGHLLGTMSQHSHLVATMSQYSHLLATIKMSHNSLRNQNNTCCSLPKMVQANILD